MLDACCGTGDLALELARVVGRSGQVTGLDFSAEMLRRAERKSAGADAATIAVGARRRDRDAVRATTPSRRPRSPSACATCPIPRPACASWPASCDRAGASSASRSRGPSTAPLKGFYSLWFDRGIPALGKVFDRRGAYSYLPASVRRFPGPEQLGEAFHRAGMTDVRYRLLAGGIVALHVGEVIA